MPSATPTADRARRVQLACALAALVAFAGGLAAISPAPVGVFWDDGVYVITAKALATGEGYRFIHLPGAPAATHYPPLWPALLALVWSVAPPFPDNVMWMKALNPVLLAASAVGATLLGVRVARLNAWLAAVVAASTIVVAPMLLLSGVLMSEPLCLALSAAGLVAATSLAVRGRTSDGLIAGACLGLAVLARSAALPLVPALAVGLLWRRSRRASLVSLGVTGALIAPWFLWSSAHAAELPAALAGSYGPYGPWLLDAYRSDPGLLLEVVARNATMMFREVGVLVFGAFPLALRPLLLAALLVSTVAGLVNVRRRVLPLVVAMVAYAALVLVWPYAPGRFMWTYFALGAAVVAAATVATIRRARVRPAWRVPAAVSAALALAALLSVVRYDVRGFQRDWHQTAITHMADGIVAPVAWIASHTAPTDTLATDVHLQAYLYADRIAVPITSLTVAEHVRDKPPEVAGAEFAAIDSAFRPQWWIASAMTNVRFSLVDWVRDSSNTVRPAATLPDGGVAARRVAR